MASLKPIKRKSGTAYLIRYRLNGEPKTHNIPLGTPYKTAVAIKHEFERQIARHKAGIESFTNPLQQDRSVLTISAYREWFFNNKKSASKRTIETYQRAFNFLIKSINDAKLTNLENLLTEIEEGFNYFNDGKQYSPVTKSIIVRSLRQAWNFGIKRGKIKENPFQKIEIKNSNALPDILNIEEKNRMYKKLEHPQSKIAFALARYAGLRREEICQNIRWEDVEWDQDMLNIPKAKTGKNQKVPMLPELKKILLHFKQDEGYLCELHPHTVTHYLTSAKKKAGIKKKGSIHILRHSLGSDLISQGLSTRSIQDLLRHSKVTTTEIYTQLSKKALQGQLKGKKV